MALHCFISLSTQLGPSSLFSIRTKLSLTSVGLSSGIVLQRAYWLTINLNNPFLSYHSDCVISHDRPPHPQGQYLPPRGGEGGRGGEPQSSPSADWAFLHLKWEIPANPIVNNNLCRWVSQYNWMSGELYIYQCYNPTNLLPIFRHSGTKVGVDKTGGSITKILN